MFMFEKAFVGGRRYWLWILCLGAIILAGFLCYLRQLSHGLVITGLSRDVTWGLYIAQFTFFVGIAASAVMVVLPYYLHNYKEFGRITILGEFLAVAAVTMCMLFVFVDMGQPARVLNVLRYPTPWSLMFWDFISLGGYLFLNALIALVMLRADREGVSPPHWIKPIVILSIPWAVSIHTVTAFLYSGLPGRTFWMTAVLAPRFLASAFASGPALLILLCLVLRRVAGFDAGRAAIHQLALIVTYAMVINVFLVLVEFFTVFYSRIPEHLEHFKYVFLGLDGNYHLAPWMWLSALLSVSALALLLVPAWRNSPRLLPLACIFVFASLWLEKGLGLIVGGFTPSPLGAVTSYTPTLPEATIVLGVWAIGALIITVLYKIALSVREAH
jgi:molybdopterin-containing oxidoreductase family membrane subunit